MYKSLTRFQLLTTCMLVETILYVLNFRTIWQVRNFLTTKSPDLRYKTALEKINLHVRQIVFTETVGTVIYVD